MKTSVRFIALIIAITATFATQTVHAQVQTIVITENSSTSLTAILNGTTSLNGNNIGTDSWVINVAPVGSPTNISGFQDWQEPGSSVGVNNAVFGLNTQLIINSDRSDGTSGLADGTTDTMTFKINAAEFDVTFHDNAATAEATVPDTGSTFGLLAVALAVLIGVSRLRSIRLA